MELSPLVKSFDNQMKSENVKIVIFGTDERVKRELASGLQKQWSDRQQKGGSCSSKGSDIFGREFDVKVDTVDRVSPFYHPLPPCQAYVLVYSAEDTASYKYVCQVREQIVRRQWRDFPTVFVACLPDDSVKIDQEVRVYRDLFISCEWEQGHYEISPRTRAGDIEKIMDQVIRRIKAKNPVDGPVVTQHSTDLKSNIGKCKDFCQIMFRGSLK